MEPEIIGDAAETVGEIAAEVIKAPFRIIGGLFGGLFG